MALHRLTSITIGVPNVEETARYYADFGLREVAPRRFATVDGGEQLTITHAATRRLAALGVGVDDPDDLARIEARLRALDVPFSRSGQALRTAEPVTGARVDVTVAPRLTIPPTPAPSYNGPGRIARQDARAAAVLRTGRVRPRKLGHVVIGTVDKEASQRFFTDGLGFRISDNLPGRAAFMRCSTDHHNVLVQQAPVGFLHHTAWEVDDVDEVGRGATAMLEEHPERHTWGLGRHHIGSNFFWYLKDPAGNFSEYYSDLDCVVEDALWTAEDFQGARGLYNWGPPPPPSFILPEDIAAAMTGAHQPS
ncbi:VOC family protein [Streptomyces sp. URMC 129]|uniref:VOC family protein n=1 Tax=Streptomyces sp. URMC 129 TaxID=3423407 RepID=UPI003F1C718D